MITKPRLEKSVMKQSRRPEQRQQYPCRRLIKLKKKVHTKTFLNRRKTIVNLLLKVCQSRNHQLLMGYDRAVIADGESQ